MSMPRVHDPDTDVQVRRAVQTMGRLEEGRTGEEGMAGQLQAAQIRTDGKTGAQEREAEGQGMAP